MKLRLSVHKYQTKEQVFDVKAGATHTFDIDTASSQGWYDFTVLPPDADNARIRYAGRLERGVDSISDPYMGGLQV